MKQINGSLAVLTALVAMSGCGTAPSTPSTIEAPATIGAPRYHAFGDSYTAGTAVNNAQSRTTYVTEVAAMVGLPLVNHGVGGTVFTGSEEYGEIMGTDFIPSDVVTMQIGFNDDFAHGDTPAYIALFKAKLIDVLARLNRAGCKTFVGKTIEHTAWAVADGHARGYPITSTSVRAYLQAIDEAVAEVAGDRIYVVDTHAAFDSTNASLMDNDHVHPNEAGYGIIARAFIAEMAKH